MEDFDAIAHIRDLHREAERRRLARLAQARVRRTNPVNPALIVGIMLLILIAATQLA